MSNELAIQVANLTPQHQAWIGMAEAKNGLVADLTEKELAAQAILMVDAKDHVAIDAALLKYRKAHADMVDVRKEFTNQIDAGIIQPLMAFEKRVDPKANAEYQTLDATSLALRKRASEQAAAQNAINQELASFKAHCTNEFFRTAADYRTLLRRETLNVYEYYLKGKLTPDTEKIRKHLSDVHIPGCTKFIPIRITADQMTEIYNELHHPDYENILEEMLGEAEKVFANFSSDLANADAAIAAQKQSTELADLAQNKQVEEETAINTLIATSEALVIDTPKIKQTLTITIVESESWAKAIMAGFISNLPALAKYIRVKSWSKLSIGQMAEYLAKLATDSDIKIKGVEYASIEK
jgi:hypothetical protein